MLDDDDKSLKEFGVKQADQLEIKDLGPQIGTPSCSLDSTMDRADRESQKLTAWKTVVCFFRSFRLSDALFLTFFLSRC